MCTWHLLPLLILFSCHVAKGDLTWTVIGKVTEYGQNVTLFCNVSNCCPQDSGWDSWTPVQRTLFIDVKSGHSNKKFDGKVLKNGYTLVIQNLTKQDLNVSYSCLYGVTLGERKFLLEEDVFMYISSTEQNTHTGDGRLSKGTIAGILVGVIALLTVPVGLVLAYFWKNKKFCFQEIPSTEEKKRYKDVLEAGYEERKHVRIQVIGKQGVGKTTLVRKLLGDKHTTNILSTDGIEIHRKCKIKEDGTWIIGDVKSEMVKIIERIMHTVEKDELQTSKPSDSDKKMQKRNRYKDRVLQPEISESMRNRSDEEKPLMSIEHMTETNDPTGSVPIKDNKSKSINNCSETSNKNFGGNELHAAETGSISSNPSRIRKLEKIDLTKPEQINIVTEDLHLETIEAMIKNMDAFLLYVKNRKDKMKSDGLVECDIWDYAGQREYYATHQTFLTSKAIYILVVDIKDGITTFQDDNNFGFESIGSYIDFWLDSIHCHRDIQDTTTEDLRPPVIIVCTGIDKEGGNREAKKEEYKQNFHTAFGANNHIRGHIHFISNKDSPTADFEELKKHISDIAKEVNFFAETLPTKWIELENALMVLKELKEKEKEYCETLESVVKIAKTMSIDEHELINFLKYQHEIGNILFFENQSKYIILKPNWLVDCFKCLVCDKAKMNNCTENEVNQLTCDGILTEHVIDKLFKKVFVAQTANMQQYILSVMEKFDIIVKQKSANSYYIPCMVTEPSTIDKINIEDNEKLTPWLVFEFKFLPITHYNHIIAYYIKAYSDNGTPTLYAGKVIINFDKSNVRRLIVCFSRNAISLQIRKWKTEDNIQYNFFINELYNEIEMLDKKLVNKLDYIIKAKCSGYCFDKENRISYDDLTTKCEGGKYYCKEHSTDHKSKSLEETWLEHVPEIEHKIKEKKKKRDEAEKEANKKQKREKEEHSALQEKLLKRKTVLIPKNIRDNIQNQIEEWEKKDTMFVSTRASDYIMEQLQDYSCLTLTAPSGVGKSFIARHTALLLQKEEYTVIPVRKPDDIRDYYQPGKKTVFLVDDICGNYTANQQQIENWKQLLPVIDKIIKDKCCKIIVSCRLQVYKDEQFDKLIPFKSCECNLISEKLCLTSEEKNIMASVYIGSSLNNIDKLSQNSEFFPLLCSLYDWGKHGDVKEFFKNPFFVYQNELDSLSKHGDEGNYRLCSLALLVLFNNQLPDKWIQGTVTREQRHLIKATCDACGLNRGTSKSKLKEALLTLEGTFVRHHDGIYRTVHATLFDFLAYYFGQRMIECLIDHGDSDLVHERFIWQKSPDDQNSNIDFIIKISDDHLELYLERFIKDWLAEKVAVVFSNNNMKVSSFRQQLIHYLQQLDKLHQVSLANTRDTVIPMGECGSGTTPLICSCHDGYIDMVQWMLHNDVDVDQCRNDGTTGLIMASSHGHTEIVNLLLEKNPNVNLWDKAWSSSLHKACQNGHTEIVRLLLETNSNVDLCDKDGCSPLSMASKEGHTDIVKLLLEKNPDVDLCDKDGLSPSKMASQNGHTDIVRLLSRKSY